jgi:hypothetical protein
VFIFFYTAYNPFAAFFPADSSFDIRLTFFVVCFTGVLVGVSVEVGVEVVALGLAISSICATSSRVNHLLFSVSANIRFPL